MAEPQKSEFAFSSSSAGVQRCTSFPISTLSPSAIVRSAYFKGRAVSVLLAQSAWDFVLRPCSSFLPTFVHPSSKCCAEVIIWAASIWSIKIGVMLEGSFTGPCQLIEQCIEECEVLSRLLCMTNIFTVKAAKCEHL